MSPFKASLVAENDEIASVLGVPIKKQTKRSIRHDLKEENNKGREQSISHNHGGNGTEHVLNRKKRYISSKLLI